LHNYNYDDFINAASFIESNYRKYPFEELIEIEFTPDNIDEAFSFAEKYKPVPAATCPLHNRPLAKAGFHYRL